MRIRDAGIKSNARIRSSGPLLVNSWGDSLVIIGYFVLDFDVKIGYVRSMFRSIVFIALRLSLIVAIWVFIWRYLEPKTQLMRIMRAALLVLCLLGVMAVVKLMGS